MVAEPVNYFLFDTEEPIDRLSRWTNIAGSFRLVAGYSALGDFFLRDPSTGQFATLFTTEPELVPLEIFGRREFEEQYLSQPTVKNKVLRVDFVREIASRTGELSAGNVYVPAPFPFLGGVGAASTYEMGNVWAFAELIAQMQGVGEGSA